MTDESEVPEASEEDATGEPELVFGGGHGPLRYLGWARRHLGQAT